jgi:hypothetical protein
MTDCERNLDRISAYLDGELDAAGNGGASAAPGSMSVLQGASGDLKAVRAGLAEELRSFRRVCTRKSWMPCAPNGKKPVGRRRPPAQMGRL